jgi:hypothetical protein
MQQHNERHAAAPSQLEENSCITVAVLVQHIRAAAQLQHLLPDFQFITLLLLLCSTILFHHLVVRVMVNLESQQIGPEKLHRVHRCLLVSLLLSAQTGLTRVLEELQMDPSSTSIPVGCLSNSAASWPLLDWDFHCQKRPNCMYHPPAGCSEQSGV